MRQACPSSMRSRACERRARRGGRVPARASLKPTTCRSSTSPKRKQHRSVRPSSCNATRLGTEREDLRGKSIALHRGSNVHYLVIRALEEAGVPYDEVCSLSSRPEVARSVFERRAVDAWAIWDLDALLRALRSGRAACCATARAWPRTWPATWRVASSPRTHLSVVAGAPCHVGLRRRLGERQRSRCRRSAGAGARCAAACVALAFLNGSSPIRSAASSCSANNHRPRTCTPPPAHSARHPGGGSAVAAAASGGLNAAGDRAPHSAAGGGEPGANLGTRY